MYKIHSKRKKKKETISTKYPTKNEKVIVFNFVLPNKVPKTKFISQVHCNSNYRNVKKHERNVIRFKRNEKKKMKCKERGISK